MSQAGLSCHMFWVGLRLPPDQGSAFPDTMQTPAPESHVALGSWWPPGWFRRGSVGLEEIITTDTSVLHRECWSGV